MHNEVRQMTASVPIHLTEKIRPKPGPTRFCRWCQQPLLDDGIYDGRSVDGHAVCSGCATPSQLFADARTPGSPIIPLELLVRPKGHQPFRAICEHCNGPFLATRSDARCCSARCKKRAERARKASVKDP